MARCAWLTWGLILGSLTTVSALAQEGDVEARTHFEAGRLHYQDGAYDRAYEEFLRAWELSHRPPLLINLATVEERLGRHAAAADHLEQFIAAEPSTPDANQLRTRIENLRRLAAAAGNVTVTTTDPATGVTTTTTTSSNDGGGLLIGAIVGFSAGGVGLILMGTFGGLALGADSSLASGCGVTGTCSDAEVADANTFAIVSDVGLGLTIAGAAAGTVLLILALTASSSSDVAFAPWVSPEGGGLSVGGVL